MSGEGRSINTFIHELDLKDIPDAVIHQARTCLVDLIGVWAAGSQTRASQLARDHAVRRYGGGEDASALPFDGRKANPPGAAFAGAATIDAVDGHDGHEITKGHAGAALLPTLLAYAGDGMEFDEFLTTLIVGYEIAHRCGVTLHATVPDYHSSGSWNGIGCAAMGARIRKFSGEATGHALGIAEYFGPRAQMMRCIDHPSMVKDSSSWGAMVGATAIDLAETGFTGAPALLCQGAVADNQWQDLGRRWTLLEMNFKPYPVCRWAQPAIEAVRSLMVAHEFTADEIAEIRVSTFHEAVRLAVVEPSTSDAAQYSLPFTVAVAAVHGTVEPKHVTDDALADPLVLAMARKVKLEENADYNTVFPAKRYAYAEITLTDGRSWQSARQSARGNFDAPLSDTELLSKFRAYCDGILPDQSIDRLASILSTGSSIGVAEMAGILSGHHHNGVRVA